MTVLEWGRKLSVLAGLLWLAGCSNGRGSLEDPPAQGAEPEFSIGGTVTGLVGSGLVLQNNGGNDLAVGSDGAITFTDGLPDGAAYEVTVLAQPVSFAPELTYFLPVRHVASAAGQVLALPVPTNTSGDFAALAGTDGYIELACEQSEFPAGSVAPLHRWR